MKAPLFFPDSAYLADKWWHRLAVVIFWGWLLLATGVMIAIAFEHYGSHDFKLMMLLCLLIYSASLFLPSVVYRAILFICTGSAWKGKEG